MAEELSQETEFNRLLRKDKLVRHQVKSFDRFVENLPKAARQLKVISATLEDGSVIELKTENLRLGNSSESSNHPRSPEAALRERVTWGAPLILETSLKHYFSKKKGKTQFKETKISKEFGFCPIIVRKDFEQSGISEKPECSSSLPKRSLGCPLDLGGYFIVDGKEKVAIPIERRWPKNSIQVERFSNYVQASILSCPRKTKMGEVPLTRKLTISLHNQDGSSKIVAIIGKLGDRESKEIPLGILFCALGLTNIKMIAGAIQVPWETEIPKSIFHFEKVLELMSEDIERELRPHKKTRYNDGELLRREAIKWISERLPRRDDERKKDKDNKDNKDNKDSTENSENPYQHIFQLLENEILSNVGTGLSSLWPKAILLGSMVKRVVLCTAGFLQETDKHSLAHKTLLLIGDLLYEEICRLLRQVWKNIEKKYVGLSKSTWKTSSDILTRVIFIMDLSMGPLACFSRCFKTGQIGGGGQWSHNGVIAPLNRQNFPCTVSQLRDVTSPIHEQSKAIDWRKTHSSHWGRYCIVETPDNAKIGLQKQLSLGARVTCDDLEQRFLKRELSGKNGVDIDMVDAEIDLDSKSDSDSDSYANACLLLKRKKGKKQISGGDVEMVDAERDSDSDSDSGSGDEVDVSFIVKELLIKELREGHREREYYGAARFFLNGRILGCHESGEQLAECLREARRQGRIKKEAGIVWDSVLNEVRVTTSVGRILRPLFHVQFDCNGARLSALEFLDAEEEMNTRVTSNMKDLRSGEHTHVEVDPSLSLGAIASTIPWFHHNSIGRNHYGTLMGKQAMGVSCTNFMERWDKTSHVLHYPQKPLIVTKSMKSLGFLDLPNGQNAIVAICPFEGYNQEDAIVFNKSAIDYGMFHSSTYKTYETQEEEKKKEKIMKCDNAPAVEKLDCDGLPSEGEILKKTNCGSEGRVVVIDKFQTEVGQRIAVRMRDGDGGQVAKAAVHGKFGKEPKMASVTVRSVRRPVPGDKFTSRHGQKGVMACVTSREDLPFSREGICPDVIISPHSIPARATPGQLLESLAAKGLLMYHPLSDNNIETDSRSSSRSSYEKSKAQLEDASAFSDSNKMEMIEAALLRSGYSPQGKELLYSGTTGKPLPALIFMGPVFYQRLPHLAENKLNARGKGGRELFTGQVPKGISEGGGYRIGEMEVSAIAAHGASSFLHSRTTKLADPYEVFICKRCKLPAKKLFSDPRRPAFSLGCPRCTPSNEIVKCSIPFAVYAIQQELMSMNIFMSLEVREASSENV